MPVEDAIIQIWETLVSSGVSIPDILSLDPDYVVTCIRKADGSAFQLSWFTDIEPFLDERALLRDDFFQKCDARHKQLLGFPAPARIKDTRSVLAKGKKLVIKL